MQRVSFVSHGKTAFSVSNDALTQTSFFLPRIAMRMETIVTRIIILPTTFNVHCKMISLRLLGLDKPVVVSKFQIRPLTMAADVSRAATTSVVSFYQVTLLADVSCAMPSRLRTELPLAATVLPVSRTIVRVLQDSSPHHVWMTPFQTRPKLSLIVLAPTVIHAVRVVLANATS